MFPAQNIGRKMSHNSRPPLRTTFSALTPATRSVKPNKTSSSLHEMRKMDAYFHYSITDDNSTDI